ncbi:MAG: alpha/beta hydrolase [Gemmatimonadales bacterium]|nr:alpha/beta hydrolase [Gemmatimonadales bacterium]
MRNTFYAFLSHPWSGVALALVVAALGGVIAWGGRRGRAPVLRVAGRLIAVAGLILLVGAGRGMARVARIRSAHPPVGRLVDVGGYRMHLLAEGRADGKPTVVWLSGSHDAGLELHHLHKAMRAETRSILFDRPGAGWSDVGPYPRTTAREVEELRTLLANAGERPPFVLVGHSYGGLLAANYARRHRGEVAAVILLDPTPPDVFLYLPGGTGPEIPRGLVRASERAGWAALFGLASNPDREVIERDTALVSLLAVIRGQLADVAGALDAGRAAPANFWATASIFREWDDPMEVAELTVYDGELTGLPVYLVVPPGKDPAAPLQLGLTGPTAERAGAFLERARVRYLAVSDRARLIHTPPGMTHNYPYQVPDFVLEVVRGALIESGGPAAGAADGVGAAGEGPIRR